MALINCEVSLFLTWSSTCAFTYSTGEVRFKIDTKLFAPVATLSTQDNVELLQQFKSGFRRKWSGTNIYQIEKIYTKHLVKSPS